jgi:hypothetical protein
LSWAHSVIFESAILEGGEQGWHAGREQSKLSFLVLKGAARQWQGRCKGDTKGGKRVAIAFDSFFSTRITGCFVFLIKEGRCRAWTRTVTAAAAALN